MFSGPLPENTKTLVGIIPNPYENGGTPWQSGSGIYR